MPLQPHTHTHTHTHTHARHIILVTYIVQFEVKAAGVTHRVSVPVAPPQGGGGGLAVCAAGACASSGGLAQTEKYTVNNDPFTCCRKVTASIKGSKNDHQVSTGQPHVPNINAFMKVNERGENPNCDAFVRSNLSPKR